ncbi:hypothetical protein P8452_37631 [Trifolium repens]|nr:hypothetical protein P8452_37631 [Trifolium repens]
MILSQRSLSISLCHDLAASYRALCLDLSTKDLGDTVLFSPSELPQPPSNKIRFFTFNPLKNLGFVSIAEASAFWHRVVVFVRFCYAAISVSAAGGDLIVFWVASDLHILRRIKCPDDYEQ